MEATSRGREPDAATRGLRLDELEGRLTLIAAVLGSAVTMLTGTVVTVALPRISQGLDADVVGLQWTVNAYLLTLASLMLVGGSLGDRLGRRRVFVAGLVGFAVASLACAFAPNLLALNLLRGVQGVAGALLTPASLAILQSSFRPQDRAAAIGAWSGLGGIAAAVGPLVGGVLVDTVGWRWVFLVNVPVAAVAVPLALRVVPESRASGAHDSQLDVGGAVLGAVGLAGVSWVLLEGARRGWGDPATVGVALGAVAAVVLFLMHERRTQNPMLPLSVFKNRQFSAANAVTLLVYAALGGVFFLLSLHLQTALGYSAVAAGAATLPITVLMLVLSAPSGRLAQARGPRLQLTLGPVVVAIGMLLLARVEPGTSYVETVLPGVVVFGLGLAAVVAPVTATVLAAADPQHAGVASGVNNVVSRGGQLLAIAVLPAAVGLTGAPTAAAFEGGFPTAMVLTAAVAVAGGLLAFLTIRDDVLQQRPAVDAGPPGPHCCVDGTPLFDTSAGRPTRD